MNSEINLSNCCRTCLRLGWPLTSLNAEDKDAVKFSFKLLSCITEIAWSRIDILSLICDQCIEQLRISYDFRNTCITADETLQKCVKQSQVEKIETKDNILFDSKYYSSSTLPDENTNNSEYFPLKHFLDSEEELGKNEAILAENEMCCSSTPENTEESFINTYNQLQTIEEIIIQGTPDEIGEQNRLILRDEEYSKQEPNTNIDNTELKHIEEEQQNHIAQHRNTERSSNEDPNTKKNRELEASNSIDNKNIVLTQFEKLSGSLAGESILGTDQDGPILKMYKSTHVEVPPLTAEDKQSMKAVGNHNTCTICGNTYRKRANLKVHIRSHTGEKPFECNYCEKRFNHSSHLKEHIRRHTGEKPFQCNICSKRFTMRGELTVHMRSHTGEKPFACSVCDRRCLTSSDLKIHMRTHTGEKPYNCENCGKKFRSACSLSTHLKIHTSKDNHQQIIK